MKLRVLVTGDRNWTNERKVRLVMECLRRVYGSDVIIVEGDARGLDRMAGDIGAEIFGKDHVEAWPADWTTYHRAAGPIRNQFMLDESRRRGSTDGHPLLCAVAFHSDLAHSKGTKDMVNRLEKAGIPVMKIT